MAYNFPDAPVIGQEVNGYIWDGQKWVKRQPGDATISATAPTDAHQGQLWWESDTGDLYIYYNDGTSAQWVGVDTSGASNDNTVGSFVHVNDFGASPAASAAINSTAFAAAMDAAVAAGCLPIHIGPGTYALNANWTVTGGVVITGCGDMTVLEFGAFGILVDLYTVVIRDLRIHSTGTCIRIGTDAGVNYQTTIENVYCWNCGVGIDIHNGALTRILNCDINQFTAAGIQISSTLNADGGDCLIDGCWILANGGSPGGSSNAAIFHVSGGGWKISNCKMVGGNVGYWHQANYVDVNKIMSSLLITDCSIEGMQSSCIAISNTSTTTGNAQNIVIDGVQGGAHSYGILVEATGGRQWVTNLVVANVVLGVIGGATTMSLDGIANLAVDGGGDLYKISSPGLVVAGVAIGSHTTGRVTLPLIANAVADFTARYTNASGANVAIIDPVAPAQLTNSLGADVLMNVQNQMFDGPVIAQGTIGTWWVSGTVTVLDGTGIANITAMLHDGAGNIIDSATVTLPAATYMMPIALSGFITNPGGNLRISCSDGQSATGKMLASFAGRAKHSTISAYRIA